MGVAFSNHTKAEPEFSQESAKKNAYYGFGGVNDLFVEEATLFMLQSRLHLFLMLCFMLAKVERFITRIEHSQDDKKGLQSALSLSA